jgi:hypothetical protein
MTMNIIEQENVFETGKKIEHIRIKIVIFTPLGASQESDWWNLPPWPGPPPPSATSEVSA